MTALAKCPWEAAAAPAASGSTNTPAFEVAGYWVEGNTVLPDEQLNGLFAKYTGPGVTVDRVREALGELQLTYRNYGFATVGVSLPPQRITNGIVRVQVTEGRLDEITIVGNRYFSSNNIRRELPGLTTNILLNTKWLEPEIDRANSNPDRQIYPRIFPGAEPGTSTLQLEVKDRLPLHGHLELNNKSTPDTPDARIDGALQYNNLWQLDHQIGVGYNFSPQELKPDDNRGNIYDWPAVASYSGFYRIPFETGGSLRNTYEQMPANFGYDEATHRFNLPALSGYPELIFYASRSTTDTGSRFGPVSTITDTSTLLVTSVTSERDPTASDDLGARLILPLPQWHGVQSSLSAGFDFKTFQSQTLVTNYTTVQPFDTNTGLPIGTPNVIPNGRNSGNTIGYAPLTIGWSGSRSDRFGVSSLGVSDNLYFAGLSSPKADIEAVAGSIEAGGTFTTINFNFSREQYLTAGWSLAARANGQWSSKPLISNEQFALGGMNSVRGYFEGDEYGDAGWAGSLEARTPLFGTQVATIEDFAPTWLRGSVFVDYGQRYLLEPPAGTSPVLSLLGTGFGLSANINNIFQARVTVAWPMLSSPNTPAGIPRAFFAINAQF